MSIALRIFSVILIIAYFILIFHLLKRKRFSLKYSLLWLFSGCVMSLFVIRPALLEKGAAFLGIEVASNALFAMCIFLMILILVLLTAIVSGLTDKNKQLVQHIAIIEKRLRELEKKEAEHE